MNSYDWRISRLAASLMLAVACMSCVNALHPNVGPLELKLQLTGGAARLASVHVLQGAAAVFLPDASGEVNIKVPAFGRGCSVYLLGFIRIADRAPEKAPLLELLVPGRRARNFTLAEFKELPRNGVGVATLQLP